MKVMEANAIRRNKNWLLVNLSPLLISAAIFISGYISKLHSNREWNGNKIKSKDSKFHKISHSEGLFFPKASLLNAGTMG